MSKKRQEEPKIDTYHEIFPTRLREVMETQNVTQAMLAARIRVSRQSVAKYTSGQAQPNTEALQSIVKYLNVSADYLLGNTDVKNPNLQMQAVCNFTGLTEKSIDTVKDLQSSFGKDNSPLYLSILNMAFEEGFVTELIKSFDRFVFFYVKYKELMCLNEHATTSDDIMPMAIWNLSNEFLDAFEEIKDKLISKYSLVYEEDLP